MQDVAELVNASFNGYIDSGPVLAMDHYVNSFACHCGESINRSVIMVSKLLIFFLFFSPPLWYLICSAQ